MEGSPTRKKLGLFDSTLLVMGGILGIGIFFNPGQVAALVPHEGAFLAMWVFGAIVAMCGAFTFAEYGGSFPEAGGWFVYLRKVYPAVVSFLFAWVVLFVVSTGALAVMATMTMSWLSPVLPFLTDGPSTANRIGASLMIVAITSLALGGVKLGATFQNACMLVKLGAVAALLIAGFCFFTPDAAASIAALEPAPPPPAGEARPLWRGMILATLPVLFAVGGWQMIGYIASEVRDVQRVLPRAILFGVGTVMLVYFLLNLDYLRVLGIERMAGDIALAPEIGRVSFGAGGEKLLGVGLAISAIGVCAVSIIASPWIYVAMSRAGIFFKRFGELHATTGAPTLALLLQAALTVMYIWISSIDSLTSSVVFVEWIFHGLVAFGLIRLRALHPELPRPFRSPLFPLMPLMYGLIATGVVVGVIYSSIDAGKGQVTLRGLYIVAIGLVVYPVWTTFFRRARSTES